MDTKNFKDLCDRLLKKYGFKKKKTMYYKDSNDGIRCGVYLQRSYYGKVYYFNYYYFLDNSDVKVQDEILLPVKKGRQVIYDMVKSGICIIYKFRSKEEEEVMQKLYDFKTGEGQKA